MCPKMTSSFSWNQFKRCFCIRWKNMIIQKYCTSIFCRKFQCPRNQGKRDQLGLKNDPYNFSLNRFIMFFTIFFLHESKMSRMLSTFVDLGIFCLSKMGTNLILCLFSGNMSNKYFWFLAWSKHTLVTQKYCMLLLVEAVEFSEKPHKFN